MERNDRRETLAKARIDGGRTVAGGEDYGRRMGNSSKESQSKTTTSESANYVLGDPKEGKGPRMEKEMIPKERIAKLKRFQRKGGRRKRSQRRKELGEGSRRSRSCKE